MPLTEAQHGALAAHEKALAKALDSLPSVTPDTDQASAYQVLRAVDAQCRDHLADIRARSVPGPEPEPEKAEKPKTTPKPKAKPAPAVKAAPKPAPKAKPKAAPANKSKETR